MKISPLKRSICLLFFTAFIISSLFAQPMPDKTALRGKVTDSAGKALGGVAITLRRSTDVGSAAFWGGVTYTDARGEFEFPAAEVGNYYLSVEAGGYAPIQNRLQVIAPDVQQVSYALQLLGELPVRVLSPDGTPIPTQAFPVTLTAPDTGAYYQFVPQVGEKGGTITSIVPGVYDLNALVPAVGYAGPIKVEVKSGTNPSIDVPLKPGGTLRIAVHEDVADGSKRPAGGVAVSFSPQGLSSGPGARPMEWMYLSTESGRAIRFTRDGDGTTEFKNVPPGLYDVSISPVPWGGPQKTIGEVKVDVPAEVVMSLSPLTAGSMTVEVKKQDGSALADTDFYILAQGLGELPKASIVPVGGAAAAKPPETEQVTSQLERRAHSDAEGKFTLYPLSPGRWRLMLRTAARGGGARTAVMTAAVEVAAGATVSTEIKWPEK